MNKLLYNTYIGLLFLTISIAIYSCKSIQPIPESSITVNYSATDNSSARIFVSSNLNFFANTFTILQPDFTLKFPTPPYGINITIRELNTDTSTWMNIYKPDSVHVTVNNNGIVLKNRNIENDKYNLYKKAFNSFYSDTLKGKYNKEKLTTKTKELIEKYNIETSLQNEFFKDLDIMEWRFLYRAAENDWEIFDSAGRLKSDFHQFISKANKLSRQAFLRNGLNRTIDEWYRILARKMNANPVRDPESLYGRYSVVKNNFKRKSLCYQYLVSLLHYNIERFNIQIKGQRFAQLRKDVKQSVFRQDVISAISIDKIGIQYDSITTNRPTDKKFYDENLKGMELEEILATYTAKPLLIDFWASWCGPCIQKLPEIQAYKEKFNNLSILFISLDKNHYDWKDAIVNRNLSFAQHYRRNYNNQDTIFENIKTIPRYGLLLKDGYIKLMEEINETIIRAYLQEY